MRTSFSLFVVLTVLCLAGTAGTAQDFVLPYNKAPETAPEFWAAAKYELQLGNHARAAEMLQKFNERLANLGEADQNKLLLAIYDRDGLSQLLRLANLESVRKVKTESEGKQVPLADALIKKMTRAIQGRLADPERIDFFVGNLSKTPEERAYAFTQLRLAGPLAVPALVKVLMEDARQKEHANVVSALVKMDKDAGPAMLAALDVPSDSVKANLLRAFELRADKIVVPFLWYLQAAPGVSPPVKAQAAALLAKFLGTTSGTLTDARGKLTEEANRFYRRQADVAEGSSIICRWDSAQNGLQALPASKSAFENYQAMYWARKALEVDPSYRPAQVVYLSAAFDKALAEGGAEQALAKTAPDFANLVAASGAEVLSEVLDRALAENRTLVALGATRALGETRDPKALRSTKGGYAPLARALNFPDPRVQFAAARSILQIPSKDAAPGASRLVSVLARAVGGNGGKRVLVAHFKLDEAQKLASLVNQAGFEGQAFTNGRALIQAADEAGDVAALVIHAGLPNPGLAFLFSELAENPNTAGLPMLLVTDDAAQARQLSQRYPKVKVISPVPATADLFKAELVSVVTAGSSQSLSDGERKAMAKEALELLEDLAEGEHAGFNLKAAEGALIRALGNDELAADAAEVLARLPGKSVQGALADLVLRDGRAAPARTAAAVALLEHLNRFGGLVGPDQVKALALVTSTATDAALKDATARLAAYLRPEAKLEGDRIISFPLLWAPAKPEVKDSDKVPVPNAPADAPAKEEKKDGQ